MSAIRRVTDPREGPLDGVSLETSCVMTAFAHHENIKSRSIEGQHLQPCVMLASYSEGTISFSVREKDIMLTVRLDELFATIKSAADASIELKEKQTKEA